MGSMTSASYDSTWEEEERGTLQNVNTTRGSRERLLRQKQQNGKPASFKYKYMFSHAARDMQNYRHQNYNHQINQEEMPNLKFYQNDFPFQPGGLYIEDLLDNWKENYDELEKNHSYIQWLFPLPERGTNLHAAPLHEAEIEAMRKDPDVKKRLLRAYKLMLGFYGLQLANEESREVTRAQNWEIRYANLNSHSHNNLRLTRILKSLGLLGYEHYQAPLVRFFLEETLLHCQLHSLRRSVLNYFIFSVLDKKERQGLVRLAFQFWQHSNPKEQFIWGPLELLDTSSQTGPVRATNNEMTTSGGRVVEAPEETCCTCCFCCFQK